MDTSLLNRHQTVKENILNLPKPAPPLNRNAIENNKVLSTYKIICGLKAYTHIWRWLKTQPLSVIKLNLAKASDVPGIFGMNPVNDLYPVIQKLHHTTFELYEASENTENAQRALKITLSHNKRINADTSLVSKVRQTKAFAMLHQQNISKYGQKRPTSTTKHSEKEKECQFNLSLCSKISQKLTQKACFLTLKLHCKCQTSINHFLSKSKGHDEIKKSSFSHLKHLLLSKKQEETILKHSIDHMNYKRTQLLFKAWQHLKHFNTLEESFAQKRHSVEQKLE